MNDENEPSRPQEITPLDFTPPPLPEPSAPPNSVHWMHRFLECNPLYLASAVLLLYGVYRISCDPFFAGRELSQLAFNFGSLQFYELALVGTASFLATRRIWYDSVLLVILENLLVFVPFILVTQAVLIDRQYVWASCVTGGLLVLARCAGLKRWMPELNLPPRLLGIGGVYLTLNIGLPLVYRAVHQVNMLGPNPTEGAEYEWVRWTWLLILPAAFALGNCLPHAKEEGLLLPQRRWLPFFVFLLWAAASTVHVYCLDYVYGFGVPPVWIAPGLWALAWTAHRRHRDFPGLSDPRVEQVLAMAPLLTPLLAISRRPDWTFFVLATLNLSAYAVYWWHRRDRRFSGVLATAALVSFLAGIPGDWLQMLGLQIHRAFYSELLVLGAVVVWTILLRNPTLAVVVAGTVFGGVYGVLSPHPAAIHWAAQVALIFFLLHSLFWVDNAHKGARVVRAICAGVWVLQTFWWAHALHWTWWPSLPALLVLAVMVLVRLFAGVWHRPTVAIAAAAATLAGPIDIMSVAASEIPSSALIVFASFVCLGLGTLMALRKHHWRSHGPTARVDTPHTRC